MTWKPIATEPKEGQFLVSEDPSDPEQAQLVTRFGINKHFNGDVVIESFDRHPTHWCPVPMDCDPENPHASTVDIMARIADVIMSWGERLAPNVYVTVRADVIVSAYAEVDRLRGIVDLVMEHDSNLIDRLKGRRS